MQDPRSYTTAHGRLRPKSAFMGTFNYKATPRARHFGGIEEVVLACAEVGLVQKENQQLKKDMAALNALHETQLVAQAGVEAQNAALRAEVETLHESLSEGTDTPEEQLKLQLRGTRTDLFAAKGALQHSQHEAHALHEEYTALKELYHQAERARKALVATVDVKNASLLEEQASRQKSQMHNTKLREEVAGLTLRVRQLLDKHVQSKQAYEETSRSREQKLKRLGDTVLAFQGAKDSLSHKLKNIEGKSHTSATRARELESKFTLLSTQHAKARREREDSAQTLLLLREKEKLQAAELEEATSSLIILHSQHRELGAAFAASASCAESERLRLQQALERSERLRESVRVEWEQLHTQSLIKDEEIARHTEELKALHGSYQLRGEHLDELNAQLADYQLRLDADIDSGESKAYVQLQHSIREKDRIHRLYHTLVQKHEATLEELRGLQNWRMGA
jgi:hypothetical protein